MFLSNISLQRTVNAYPERPTCIFQFVRIAFVRCAAVNQTSTQAYYLFDGYAHLAAGLSCGLAGLAAGMAIGIVGDAGVRQVSKLL